MAFEELGGDEPLLISYLDVYVLTQKYGFKASKNLELELEESGNQLFGLPELSDTQIKDALEAMGMDLSAGFEESVCLHRPKVLSLHSDNEATPIVYGLAYHGFLKEK